MASRAKAISPETREAAKELKSQGLSRSKIARELDISERQVSRALGRAPEERIGRGLSAESREIRDSFIKNARSMGLDTRIRGNVDYQNFKREIEDLNKDRQVFINFMGRREGNREYSRQRIETYYKFGLISDEQRERYLQGR